MEPTVDQAVVRQLLEEVDTRREDWLKHFKYWRRFCECLLDAVEQGERTISEYEYMPECAGNRVNLADNPSLNRTAGKQACASRLSSGLSQRN